MRVSLGQASKFLEDGVNAPSELLERRFWCHSRKKSARLEYISE